MKVVQISEAPKEPIVSPLFTGVDVMRQALVPDSKEYRINIVNFGRGVRNKFHAHDSEQVLIVTAGTCNVATEQEETVAAVGNINFTPK